MRKSHIGLVTSQAESAFGEPEKGEQGEHLDPSKTADSSEPLIEVLHLLEKKKSKHYHFLLLQPKCWGAGTHWGARRWAVLLWYISYMYVGVVAGQ